MKINSAHVGTGFSREQVSELSNQIDISGVSSYWDAVVDYTMQKVDLLSWDVLNEIISEDEVRQVLHGEGVKHEPIIRGAIDRYAGLSRCEALYHFSLTHYYWHGGEIRTIQSLMDAD